MASGPTQYEYSVLSTSITSSELGLDAFDTNDDDDPLINNDYDTSMDPERYLVKNTTAAPSDRYKFVQLTFGLLGLASLMPWNFFITANDYWLYKFRDVSEDDHREAFHNKTKLQVFFGSYLAMTSNCPFLAVVFLNAFLGHKVSQNIRNGGALILMIIIFVVTSTLVLIDSDQWQMTFFSVTLITVVIINVSAATLQAGVGGLASMFPPNCIHAVVNGQALAGIFASVAQIISLLNHSDPKWSAFFYFICATFFLLVTLIAFLTMQRMAFFKFFLGHGNSSINSATKMQLTDFSSVVDTSLTHVWKRIWPYAVTNTLLFTITIAVFPAITALVVSTSEVSPSLWTSTFFTPVCCFLLFNLMDLGGRMIGKWLPVPQSSSGHILLCGSASRVVFIPLFMLCNANAHSRNHLPIVFTNDAYFVVFMSLFSLTNGYFFSNAMFYGPQQVGAIHQEKAGFLLVAFIGLGLTLGSIFSFLLVNLL